MHPLIHLLVDGRVLGPGILHVPDLPELAVPVEREAAGHAIGLRIDEQPLAAVGMVGALRHDFDRQRVAQLPTPQGRPARGAVVAGIRILRVHDVEHVLAPVERPRIVQHPPGEAEEVVERGVRPLERVGLFLRGDAPHLAQRGDVRPRLVGQMGVVRALDENTQAAHFVRVREFGHLFPLELSGPVDRQGVVVIGPHRQMAVIHALVTL